MLLAALILATCYVGGCALFVGGMYAWLALDPRRPPPARLGRALWRELGWALRIQALIPLGWCTWPRRWTRPARPGELPVIFLHGYGQSRADFYPLARRWAARGRGSLYGVNYLFLAPVQRSARRLARAVERIRRQTGAPRVHLVAHSLGGLVSRVYVERLGGAESVACLVALASPLAGTCRARFALGPSAAEMTPGSALLQDLGPPSPPPGLRYHALWSHADEVVVPGESGSLRGAGPERVVADQGHLALCAAPPVLEALEAWLDGAPAAREAPGRDAE